ncbi:MAG: hypothetical protein IJD90_03255, partial [Clostridia bacterium]|nr:hypothetical protein [Clostridia bacterium]
MKKILSIAMCLCLILSTFTFVGITARADTLPLTAYSFEIENYNPYLVSNKPTTVETSDDGSVRIKSDHVQNQYQLYFRVSDQQAMKEAIEEACKYYSGFLSVDIKVNSALTAYGEDCRPTVSVSLMDKANGTRIATIGENSLNSEQTGQYILDVSKFMEEEYTDQIQYVLIQVQCYNWGCGGGLGTQPDVTVYPIEVYNKGVPIGQPNVGLNQNVGSNQTTFFKFSPKAKNDNNNDPELLYYSGDGEVWRMGALAEEENYGYARFKNSQKNYREQVQTSFSLDQMGDAAANALNLAKQGSGYLKLSVTLEECDNMQGKPTIAEVGVAINTQAGIKAEAPPNVQVTAWQYPGTTRDYYLDVSQIEHISQISNLAFRVQNYWWYRAGTNEMFDWNEESKYAGKEAGEALGHVKCEIQPTLVVSPISVYNGNREDVKNTDYDLVLNDFNKNGGVVPEVITLDDPNIVNFDQSPEEPTVKPEEPTVKPDGPALSIGKAESDNDGDITVPLSIINNPGFWGINIQVKYDEKLVLKSIEKVNNKIGSVVYSVDDNILTFLIEADCLQEDIKDNGVLINLVFNVEVPSEKTEFYIKFWYVDRLEIINSTGQNIVSTFAFEDGEFKYCAHTEVIDKA